MGAGQSTQRQLLSSGKLSVICFDTSYFRIIEILQQRNSQYHNNNCDIVIGPFLNTCNSSKFAISLITQYLLYNLPKWLPAFSPNLEMYGKGLTPYTHCQSQLLMSLRERILKNTVGKGKNARNQLFLLFPTVFSTLLERI